MKTILVANLAGGVGKTTTVHCLATAFAEYGKRVLAIDGDPGAYLTFRCGIENPRFSTAELFAGESDLAATVVKSNERFSLAPSATRLANWTATSITKLPEQLADFEIVLIDSPSGPNQLIPTLIEISDLVLAPVVRDFHSIRGLLNLRDFVALIRSDLPVKLVDLALRDWNSELWELVREEFTICEPAIRRFPEEYFEVSRNSLLTDAPQSLSAADYRELAYSILEEFGLI